MEIKVVCEFCKGVTKLFGETPCPFCLGLGNKTILKPSNGYYSSTDVLGCFDFAEFQALNTNKTQAIELIISADYVNLNAGSVRDEIRECFPSGTITNTNLAQLIGEQL